MIEIGDLRSLVKGLDRLQSKMEQAAKQALAETAVKVAIDSQALVPVDTGELRDSLIVSELVEVDGGYDITISYQAPYAGKVHEDLDDNHPRGGQAKFLETPFLQAGDTLTNLLTKEIK